MAATNSLKFYPEIVKTEYIETLQKNVEAFRAQGSPQINFAVRNLQGELQKSTYLQKPSETVQRADRTDEGEASLTGVSEGEQIHPRIEGVTKRYTMGRLELNRAEMSPEQYSGAIGQWSATGQLEDYVESGLSALVGALTNVSDVEYDHGAKADTGALISGIRTHGDKAQDIGAFVMPAGAYYDIMQDNYTNGSDTLVGATAYQGNVATLGKPVIVADIEALNVRDASDNVVGYRILGLRTGALELVDFQQMEFTTKLAQTKAGNRQTMMGDYAFDIRVRGASFTGGQTDPTVAELANSSNWTATNANAKYSAGCVIEVTNS